MTTDPGGRASSRHAATRSAAADTVPRRSSRARGLALRIACAVFALVWLTFGFGIIDLVSGFTSVGDADPLGIGVLSAAYGAVAGVVLPVALLSMLRKPERRSAAVQQIAAVAVAFALAGAVGLDPLCFISVVMLAVMLAVVMALHPARPPLLPGRGRMSRRMLLVAVVPAAPWLVHALVMAAHSRARVPPEVMAARPQAGGWAGAAVLSFVVILLSLLAAMRSPGWRVPQWSAALASIAFGFATLLNPELPGSPGAWWGGLAVAWGLALIVAGDVNGERQPPEPSAAADSRPLARSAPAAGALAPLRGWLPTGR